MADLNLGGSFEQLRDPVKFAEHAVDNGGKFF